MADFFMQIAGHTARVRSLFTSTPDFFRKYLTDEAPGFTITVTPEDLIFEQQDALEEAREEGFKPRIFPDPFLERAAIQRQFAEYLIRHDILLFHGSLVAVDEEGYLFTARSGTGKSTHTRLWQQVFGQRARMVNDDKPFLRITDAGVLAYGSPWSGKHGLDSNICVPLKGICLLERGVENQIFPADKEQLLSMLQKQAYTPMDPTSAALKEALVNALAEKIPLWRMRCNKDPQAAEVSYTAMSQSK